MASARFLADGMFGSLCRRLRTMGFACRHHPALRIADDDGLIRAAMDSGEILLSGDSALVGRGIVAEAC